MRPAMEPCCASLEGEFCPEKLWLPLVSWKCPRRRGLEQHETVEGDPGHGRGGTGWDLGPSKPNQAGVL